ncbi:HAD family hydrolase [soil metagenome]|jgi:HAD superfamily hydrolase (TIGR01549 family)
MSDTATDHDSIDTIVFDVDGTLVDTNYHHALAWFRAFRAYDVTPALWRIHRAIGMGGDKLVAAVGGDEVEDRHGDALRDRWSQEFDLVIDEVQPFEGARALLEVTRSMDLRVVLASSGKGKHVDHYLDLLDARELAHDWTTAEDAEQSKPAPDLVETAMRKVGTSRAVMIGDSVWDAEAGERAGLATYAVRTGGFSESELTEAGARRVYDSLEELREDLARVVEDR